MHWKLEVINVKSMLMLICLRMIGKDFTCHPPKEQVNTSRGCPFYFLLQSQRSAQSIEAMGVGRHDNVSQSFFFFSFALDDQQKKSRP